MGEEDGFYLLYSNLTLINRPNLSSQLIVVNSAISSVRWIKISLYGTAGWKFK